MLSESGNGGAMPVLANVNEHVYWSELSRQWHRFEEVTEGVLHTIGQERLLLQ